MSGFVVCRSCGTRIKAGRGHCLKCFEPLPDPDEPVRLPLSESLGLSRNQEIMLAVGTAVAVALLAVVIWQTWPTSDSDEAQPVSMPVSSAAPVQTPPVPALSDAPGQAAAESPAVEAPGGAAAAPPDPDLDAVRAEYESKLVSRPNDPELHNKLGQTLERMGRLEDAEKQFSRAVSLAPLEPAYRINAARSAGALGHLDRSVDQYRESVRLRPRDYDTLTALGQTLQKKNDDYAAVVEFQKARRINPSGAAASLGLATSLEKVGRIDDALKEFHLYLDIQPTPADADKVRAHIALLSRSTPQVK